MAQLWLYLLLASVAVLVVTIFELNFVFRPIMWQLLNEENGTRVLLKMIPLKVRRVLCLAAVYAAP